MLQSSIDLGQNMPMVCVIRRDHVQDEGRTIFVNTANILVIRIIQCATYDCFHFFIRNQVHYRLK
jgi:hypothetical protein